MELSREKERTSIHGRGRRMAAWLLLLLAIAVIFAWLFEVEWLKRPLPNSVAMNPLTAICFLLFSLALLKDDRSKLQCFLIWSVLFLSLTKTISLLTGQHFPIDTYLFADRLQSDAVYGISNHMAPNTAIGFILVSLAFLARLYERPVWISEMLVTLAIAQSLLSMIGYGFQVPEFYDSLSHFPMAVHTAFGFMLLCVAMFFIRPFGPFVGALTDRNSGGLVARTLLPMAIGLPILLGALRLYGERQGMYSGTFGLMLQVSSIILLFCFVIWRVAIIINEKDHQQQKTELALAELNEKLEERVAQRTTEAIRQRQKAEKAAELLKDNEQRFRALVENAGDAVLVVDEKIRPTYVSASSERMLGYNSTEVMELDILSIIHPNDVEGVRESLMKSIKHPGLPIAGHTARVKHKDGSWRWLEATITNLLHDPAVQGIVDNFRDVTERMEAEQQLVASELKFRTTLNNMLEGVQIIGYDWKFQYVNKAVTLHGGLAEDQLLGRSIMDCYPGIEKTELFKQITLVMENRQSVQMENLFEYPNGNVAWFELSIQPVPEGVFILSIDITERKRAQSAITELNASLERKVEERTAQLKASNKELESFSYSVSHDLRAPLRAINGFAKMMEQQTDNQLTEESKRLLSVIKTNAQTMGRLIDDLLEFSRTGRTDINRSEVEMTKVVNELIQNMDTQLAQVQVEAMPMASCDASMIKQVWANLLSNALKYSARNPEPKIRVWSTVERHRNVYHIQDNGVGFDMQYASKLFGVFQRLHSPRDFEGTGVGLAIVYRIVGKHGGQAWAEAELGKGATFHFSLPTINSATNE